MQQEIRFLINPQDIEKQFSSFDNQNPFSLKNEYKEFRKKYKNKDEAEFLALLALEIQNAYKKLKKSNYIYYCKNQHKISIIKFRIKDASANAGKSGGWRVVALVDGINNVFYLLSLFSHSNGKDNLNESEKTSVKALCEEYYESMEEYIWEK